jgi:hypothetical protein
MHLAGRRLYGFRIHRLSRTFSQITIEIEIVQIGNRNERGWEEDVLFIAQGADEQGTECQRETGPTTTTSFRRPVPPFLVSSLTFSVQQTRAPRGWLIYIRCLQ